MLLRSNRTRAASVVLVLAAGLTSVSVSSSQAQPKPSLADVRQRLAALDDRAEAISESYNASQIALRDASLRAAVARARVAAAQAQLTAARRQMGALVGAAYRMGGNDPMIQLVQTSTPQTFLDRAGALDRIAAQQSMQLALAATARHRVESASADMRARLATQQSLTRQLASEKAQIDDLLGQQKRLLAGLQADQRRALAASRRTVVPVASRQRSVAVPVVEGNASARAMIAVRAALAQLGKPYQWGAAGPSTFDCSGLTMWAWGKAGVSLPHYTGAQWNVGRHISRAELQPGDLVFYYSDLHHMAMYIGGGRVVHAPHTGDVVKTGPLDLDPYEGAVRVLG